MPTDSFADDITFIDLCPETDTFLDEVVEGLSKLRKTLPYKFFYDARGSALFDQITELDVYYPTRTEVAIMESGIDEMVQRLGAGVVLIEYGSGSSLKTRILLDHLEEPVAYVPIDISKEHLLQSAQALSAQYPGLRIYPVCADYTAAFSVPEVDADARVVVYFPGSTIGNFAPAEAEAFLRRLAGVVGLGGGLLIGMDLKKDPAILERAYDDPEGVTAAFNKNLLRRINDDLGGTFDLGAFRHEARYQAARGRVEMHLVSLRDQHVRVGAHTFRFQKGETIHTENSHKYDLDDAARLAAAAGFTVEEVWTDDAGLFSVQYWDVVDAGA